MKNGCKESDPTSVLQIGAAPDFGLFLKTQKAGINTDVCIQCLSASGELIDSPTIQIKQKANCANTLQPQYSGPPPALSMMYKNNLEPITVISNTFKQYFINTNEAPCPIILCKLMQQGCVDDYINSYISMTTGPMYSIQSRLNYAQGFDETICVVC